MKLAKTLSAALVGVAALTMATAASAAAIITNGTITLGVDDEGQLNIPGGMPSPVSGTTTVGLRFNESGNEATSHGCLCEGWGVGIGGTGIGGSANNNFGGADGLALISFMSDATTATSVVSAGMGQLEVTHAFAPAAETPNLYRVTVSITNTSGADIANLLYRRTFDWDVEPTTFDEFVTIGGSAAATAVTAAVDNGFCDSSVFAGCAPLIGGSGDFTDLGPDDIGANFDFDFGALADGDTFTFEIFYGAALTERGALAALAAVGAEVFSLGQCSSDPRGVGDAGCNTFVFGFRGVGGDPVPPIPVPAALPLFLAGLAGFGALRRRRQAA